MKYIIVVSVLVISAAFVPIAPKTSSSLPSASFSIPKPSSTLFVVIPTISPSALHMDINGETIISCAGLFLTFAAFINNIISELKTDITKKLDDNTANNSELKIDITKKLDDNTKKLDKFEVDITGLKTDMKELKIDIKNDIKAQFDTLLVALTGKIDTQEKSIALQDKRIDVQDKAIAVHEKKVEYQLYAHDSNVKKMGAQRVLDEKVEALDNKDIVQDNPPDN